MAVSAHRSLPDAALAGGAPAALTHSEQRHESQRVSIKSGDAIGMITR